MARDIVIIPGSGDGTGRTLERDERLQVRGDESSGVANVRMRCTLHTERFSMAPMLGALEMTADIAERIRDALSENFAQGLDAQGRALPPIMSVTVERRERRRRQREDELEAKADRMKIRGGRNRGKVYDTIDTTTPLHESGAFAENIDVRFKGIESGDPVWLIAFASGGKKRGLVNDDGRGARLFAAEHYGFERLGDIPRQLDKTIDDALEAHIGHALREGVSIFNRAATMGERLDAFLEQAVRGDTDE